MRDKFLTQKITGLLALGFLSFVSICLWAAGAFSNHSFAYWYLIWNLFLGWLPLFFVGWLIRVLRSYPWLSWRALVLTFLWLAVLPNSFYLVTDFIHLGDVARLDLLYDTIMFESFVISGLVVGFLSLYLVHQQLLKRTSRRHSALLVALALLVCSFAIYLGRDLRWSSWDIFTNPGGLLFSVADTFVNMGTHFRAFTLTLTAFVFLGSIYLVAMLLIWSLGRPEDLESKRAKQY